MSPRPLLVAGSLFALLALVLVLGGADTAYGQTFNPGYEITLVNPEPEANSDFTGEFSLPAGDVQFAAAVFFIPTQWGITPGDEIPIGAVVGELTATATLGLINNACNNPLPVTFQMLNASTDPSDTVDYLDTDENGTPDYFEDKDGSGLQDGFEKYPDFITRVLDDEPGDEVGEPLQPIRRAAGIAIVAGVKVLLQFLVFEPGTLVSEYVTNDEELGFPTVTLLQNAGDPAFDPIPSAITDFCTPLTSSNTTYGVSKDNACTDTIPADQLDALCEVTSALVAEAGGTTPDESGVPLFTNPQDATYTFTVIAAGQRDADGDGIENALDTCSFDPNVGDPRVAGDGDLDNDGLDAACDPDDNETNSDEDLDGYLNRGDNCPLEPNGENEDNQRDTDRDGIGDACDPDPDDADAQGQLTIKTAEIDVVVGTGTGDPAPPSGVSEDGGGDGDDDGGGSALIIIIIVVIAAVVVVGGGAFYFMRRGGGGGATA